MLADALLFSLVIDAVVDSHILQLFSLDQICDSPIRFYLLLGLYCSRIYRLVCVLYWSFQIISTWRRVCCGLCWFYLLRRLLHFIGFLCRGRGNGLWGL